MKKKHQKQAFAYFVLGQLHAQQGDIAKAIKAYKKSEEIYDAILKEKTIDDVLKLYAALAILGLKTQDNSLTIFKLLSRSVFESFQCCNPLFESCCVGDNLEIMSIR